MEKLVITNEQEKVLKEFERHTANVSDAFTLYQEGESLYYGSSSLYDQFTPEQFALLLCGWYEVEESFKVGDWAIYENGVKSEVFLINSLENMNNDTALINKWGDRYPLSKSRKATAEEIAQEKKRRFWAELDRRVDEIRKGDVVAVSHGTTKRYGIISSAYGNGCNVNMGDGYERYNYEDIKLVTPVEKRVDL